MARVGGSGSRRPEPSRVLTREHSESLVAICLLAVVAQGEAAGTQDGLLAVVSTSAAMFWALHVVVCAATSLLAMAVVRQYGGERWAASIAGLAARAVMCWPQFFVFVMGGFQSTTVQALLLAAVAMEVLLGKAGELRAVVIGSAGLVLTAVEWVVAGIFAGALCLATWRRSRAAGWVGLAVVAAFLESIATWLLLDVSLSSYYPTKLFWHAAALGVPLVAAWCTVGFLFGQRRLGPQPMRFVIVPAVCVILTVTVLVGLAVVFPAASGEWSKDGGMILKLVTSPLAPKAQVVWRAGETDQQDWSIQRLVSACHPWEDVSDGGLWPSRGLREQCGTLPSVRSPGVLSGESQAKVRAHFSCAPKVVSVPVSSSAVG